MYRPGLGAALAGLLAPPAPSADAGSPPRVAIVKWVLAGRETPYIAPGGSALVEYAWINLKTNAIEVRQPDPAGVLLARYQQHGGQ